MPDMSELLTEEERSELLQSLSGGQAQQGEKSDDFLSLLQTIERLRSEVAELRGRVESIERMKSPGVAERTPALAPIASSSAMPLAEGKIETLSRLKTYGNQKRGWF